MIVYQISRSDKRHTPKGDFSTPNPRMSGLRRSLVTYVRASTELPGRGTPTVALTSLGVPFCYLADHFRCYQISLKLDIE